MFLRVRWAKPGYPTNGEHDRPANRVLDKFDLRYLRAGWVLEARDDAGQLVRYKARPTA